MKLLLLNRFYAPDHSATAQICTDLAEHFAQRGEDVTVICGRVLYGQKRGDLPRREIRNGVRIVRVATPALGGGMLGRVFAYLAAYLGLVVATFRFADSDTRVIVMTDPPLLCVPATLAARLRGAKVIQWVQDLYPEIAVAYGIRLAEGPLGKLLAMVRNRAFGASEWIVAIGHSMAARLQREGVSADRLRVVQNWTNDGDITPLLERSLALRAEWEIAPDAFVVGYSGNLGRAHEADTIFAAAQTLAHRNDCVFLFIGGGHALEQLRHRAAELDLRNIVFRPYQPRERLRESLNLPDVHWISVRPDFEGLVVPSKMFGICAAGRPIIAICDAQGEVPTLLGAGTGCVVVAPGDGAGLVRAIEQLAADRGGADAIGRAGRGALEAGFGKTHAFRAWDALIGASAVPESARVAA